MDNNERKAILKMSGYVRVGNEWIKGGGSIRIAQDVNGHWYKYDAVACGAWGKPKPIPFSFTKMKEDIKH